MRTTTVSKPQPRSATADDGSSRSQRRAALLAAMADHLLVHGLEGSPLRALAAAAETSDRMLIYYFTDRSTLMTDLLDFTASRLATLLADGNGERRPYSDLLSWLWSMTQTPAFRPYMLLFVALSAAAGRGEEPYRTAAGRIAQAFIDWVAARLDANENVRRAQAALLLATLDGLFILDCVGCNAEAEMAMTVAGDRR